MVEYTMDVTGWLRKQLEEASPDLLRAMVKEFAGRPPETWCTAACSRTATAVTRPAAQP